VSETSTPRQTQTSVSRGYEQQDIAVGRLAAFGVGLGVAVLAFFLLMWVLFGRLAEHQTGLSSPASPLSEADGRRLPPLPRLEPNLPMRLAELHHHENAMLETYGWVDRSNGVIRIPIERAMALLVQRYAQEAKADEAAQGANDE